MGTKNGSKLNQLLQNMPTGTVLLSSWLIDQGYSHDLQQKYIRSRWLTPIGKGAYIRTGNDINILGAVYALQKQAKKTIHPGGHSALYLHGYAHYVAMDSQPLTLFAPQSVKLPVWFTKHFSGQYTFRCTSLLPVGNGMNSYNQGNFDISISSVPRAMLECLEMAPIRFDLEEAWLIMEGLSALLPSQVQSLLEHCNSIKAKRLFLYFAEKAGHDWFKHLDISSIMLGAGKRSIVKNGVFSSKYQITLPKNLI